MTKDGVIPVVAGTILTNAAEVFLSGKEIIVEKSSVIASTSVTIDVDGDDDDDGENESQKSSSAVSRPNEYTVDLVAKMSEAKQRLEQAAADNCRLPVHSQLKHPLRSGSGSGSGWGSGMRMRSDTKRSSRTGRVVAPMKGQSSSKDRRGDVSSYSIRQQNTVSNVIAGDGIKNGQGSSKITVGVGGNLTPSRRVPALEGDGLIRPDSPFSKEYTVFDSLYDVSEE